MPQLDIISYFAQFVWFSVTFLTFYYWMTQEYLPKMRASMSIRLAYTQTLEDSVEVEPSIYAKEVSQHREDVNADLSTLFTQSMAAYQTIVEDSNG